ncbi:MAG: PKD domain-containing protein, partial [Acidiferrobacterales bacterium]
QQPAAAAANGNVSWSFDWSAPAAGGNYTLYGAGLSANANGGTSGDGGSTAVLLVTVSTGAAQAPVAAIKAPLTAPVTTSITFDGSGSTDVDGTIAQYDWDFGDSTVATGAITTHSFALPGTYTVTLLVTDDANLTNKTFVDITIGGAMIPSANPGGPYTGEPTVVINFDATGSTHDSAITRYLWDYGDGTAFETTTTPTGSHTYATQGSYTLTVAVQDASFMTGVAATTVTVTGAPPPTTGEGYYNAYCLSCHGTNGNGGQYEGIRNESASDINKAIAKEPLMQSIVLPGGAAELIAEFLSDKKMK